MTVFNLQSSTETLGTAIKEIIPGVANSILQINSLTYTSGTTGHTIYIMRPVAVAIADTAATASQAVINFTDVTTMKGPNTTVAETLASQDYIGYQDSTGKFQIGLVTSVAANAVTLSNSLTTSINAGQTIWIFGELARASHLQFTPPVSATTTIPMMAQAGIPGQVDSNSNAGIGHPVIVYSNNATAAGILVSVSGQYISDVSSVTMT
jgi:hypothetical protein